MGRTLIGLILGYVGLGLIYDTRYYNMIERIRKDEGFIEAIERVQNPTLSEILLRMLFRPIIKIMIEIRLRSIRKEVNEYNRRTKEWKGILY